MCVVVMAMMGWMWAGMELVLGRHAGQSQVVGRMSGDAGAFPECVGNTLVYPDRTTSVRGAPWSAANRLHGQRTGAFSWLPVLGLSRKTDQFRLDPTQNCSPGWWCDRESSVYHLALEMYSGIFRQMSFVPHAYQTPAPSLPPSNPP